MNPGWVRSFIALGANLGDRLETLEASLDRLQADDGIQIVRVSSWYETDPVGMNSDSPLFLNGVAELKTNHSPLNLLDTLLQIERRFGRNRHSNSGSESRPIDLDLLIFGSAVWNDEWLILPHPRLHKRLFVLVPFLEIAPSLTIPGLGHSVFDLLQDLRNTTGESEPRRLSPSKFRGHVQND